VPGVDLKEAFAILEIEYGSSIAEARTAYRRLCIVWHPDRFQDVELKTHAEEKLKRINEAYSTIKNAAATNGSAVDSDPGPVYEDLACRYMGGDVRLGNFAKNEPEPHCAVRIATDGLLMVTFRDGQVDESATYSLDTFVRLSVPGQENQRGNTQRDEWIRPADTSRFFARPPSFFEEDAIEIAVWDPEGILDHAMIVIIKFRNGYYAKLFGKRMREAWGLVKPVPKPNPKPKPKPKPEDRVKHAPIPISEVGLGSEWHVPVVVHSCRTRTISG